MACDSCSLDATFCVLCLVPLLAVIVVSFGWELRGQTNTGGHECLGMQLDVNTRDAETARLDPLRIVHLREAGVAPAAAHPTT